MSDSKIIRLKDLNSKTLILSTTPSKTSLLVSDNVKPQTYLQTQSAAEPGTNHELTLVIRGLFERFLLRNGNQIKLGRFDPAHRQMDELDLTPYGAQDRGVSRLHSRIHVENDELFITDLNSANGTYIGTVKVVPHVPTILRKGDELILGRLPIQIMYR